MTWYKTRSKVLAVHTLVLRQELLQVIQTHALNEYPIETCGFLAGRFDGNTAKAERFIIVKNIAASADRFILDPKECEQVRENLWSDEELISFFHSHADAPEPSRLDKINMRLLPLVWLILGNLRPRITDRYEYVAFKTNRKETIRIELVVIKSSEIFPTVL